jgi:hypothetical protein
MHGISGVPTQLGRNKLSCVAQSRLLLLSCAFETFCNPLSLERMRIGVQPAAGCGGSAASTAHNSWFARKYVLAACERRDG